MEAKQLVGHHDRFLTQLPGLMMMAQTIPDDDIR
jgi:hypothetical protein